ncbi:MAG: nuclear transport factor 2 family protein [Planctomycetes bacterium]|nr:nuclear transport factor 2 family protein [Planctomycetota bacterium]
MSSKLALLTLLTAAGCATPQHASAVVRDLIAADNRGDLEASVGAYTDDVVWRSAAGEVRGKAAIRERYREMFGAFDVHLEVAIDGEVARGDEVLVTGITKGRLQPRAGGEPKVVDDEFTATLRRDSDRWRIRELAWRPRMR